MSSQTTHPEYVLGTADDEFIRLGLQHALWADFAGRSWKHAGIAPGQRVLDVGCGPGYATMDLARLVRGVPHDGAPPGHVVALDESPGFVERLKHESSVRGINNILAIAADVQRLDRTDLEPGSFDLAYARWVLCFVPDPGAVVAGVARLLKPGGRFVVNDYFNYEAMTLAPRRESFSRVIEAVGASWRARGGDPDVVGRLPALCREHGLTVTRLEAEQRVPRPSDTMWAWPDTFFRNFVPRLVEGGFLSGAEADAYFADWTKVSADPNAFIVLPVVFELIATRQ